MSTDIDTPRQGNDHTDLEDEKDDWPPMMDESDEKIAVALEGQKQQTRNAADAVTDALLNEDEPLTDKKVHDLWKAADALTALSATICHRVPPEYQVDPDADRPYYDD